MGIQVDEGRGDDDACSELFDDDQDDVGLGREESHEKDGAEDAW